MPRQSQRKEENRAARLRTSKEQLLLGFAFSIPKPLATIFLFPARITRSSAYYQHDFVSGRKTILRYHTLNFTSRTTNFSHRHFTLLMMFDDDALLWRFPDVPADADLNISSFWFHFFCWQSADITIFWLHLLYSPAYRLIDFAIIDAFTSIPIADQQRASQRSVPFLRSHTFTVGAFCKKCSHARVSGPHHAQAKYQSGTQSSVHFYYIRYHNTIVSPRCSTLY
jgi:hypothetical protein